MARKMNAHDAIWNRASIVQRLVEDNEPRHLKGAIVPEIQGQVDNLCSIDRQCDRIKELVKVAILEATRQELDRLDVGRM